MSADENILREKLVEIEPNAANFTISLPIITSSSGKRYFAKVGSRSETEQYTGETESLKHIYNAAPGLAPRVLQSGISPTSGKPYFISEYLDITYHSNASMKKLASRLASELHVYKSDKGFGFDVPTFCGATRMKNGWYDTWESCYDALIGGLQEGLEKRGATRPLCEKIAEVRRTVIPFLLGPLNIEPVLLHGDLWSGNTGLDKKTNEPVIYDPSSFYGHNEADLAIARIFGGFPTSFFEKYHELLPKSEPADQYEQRLSLYKLFHYLNHALLFGSGGGYASTASELMDELIKICQSK